MTNTRIIGDNALERATSITASSTSGLLVANNIRTDIKSDRHRGQAGTSVTYTVTWASPEPLSGLALLGNFSPTTTIRVRVYAANGATVLRDTGVVLACPAPAVKLRGFTPAQAASAFEFGGGAWGKVWFDLVQAYKIVVDIVDLANLQGYIECGYMITGEYLELETNPAWGISVSEPDLSKSYRDAALNLRTDRKGRTKVMSFNLAAMKGRDRTAFMGVCKYNGTAFAMFICVYPGANIDPALARDFDICGKLSKASAVAIQSWDQYSGTVEINGI